jgi:ribosomal protein L12E/L44/L45/RPP1/RPP2
VLIASLQGVDIAKELESAALMAAHSGEAKAEVKEEKKEEKKEASAEGLAALFG